MMVWRNSVACTPKEREDLQSVLYVYLTEYLGKKDPKRKKFLKYYRAFKNAGVRQKEDERGR